MEEKIKVPEGVKVRLDGSHITVSGKLGELKQAFSNPDVKISVHGNEILLRSDFETRNQKKIVQTFKSEINSMFKGVAKGFKYKMKIIFVHFPVTMKVEKEKVRIENFLGERSPRFARIFPNVDVKVTKQDVELKGIDLYAVSQSAANIEQACRITRRDRRVFQDGIYITAKDSE